MIKEVPLRPGKSGRRGFKMDYFIGIIFVVLSGLFAYMSSHMVSEQKAGRRLRLPWESDFKPYDKANTYYCDGDNT